ncbi:hypothetical protein ACHAPT_010368 [Fusarium lateritium]
MDGQGGGPSQPPGHDIFCTPENSSFLSKTPYKTLDPTIREIRLLRVLPDSGSGLVECELLPSAPLADLRGHYVALSYCAGSPRNTVTILVNGVECNVFSNLCHALTCARHFWTAQSTHQDLLLWADQICINQADLSERSHQVGFMRDIYQSAQQTLICLSTCSTEGRGMKWFVENCDKDMEWDDLVREWRQLVREWACMKNSAVDALDDVAAFYEEVIASPWWSRAWVFQEFLVSAHATFLSGHHQISWMDAWATLERYSTRKYHVEQRIYDLIESLRDFRLGQSFQVGRIRLSQSFHVGRILLAVGSVRQMLQTKAKWKSSDGLMVFLNNSRNYKASDDRDRIYAFLGLADPRYGIVPDYSTNKTLCDVLTETTKNIILFEKSLFVLSAPTTPRVARRSGLPSWAVDWTKEQVVSPPGSGPPDALNFTPQGGDQAIASFRETTHPETFGLTTVMEVTGIFAQQAYYTDPLTFAHNAHRIQLRDFVVPTTCGLEVWFLCGSALPFILQRKPYGYQIIRHGGGYELRPRPKAPFLDSTRRGAAERRVISIF